MLKGTQQNGRGGRRIPYGCTTAQMEQMQVKGGTVNRCNKTGVVKLLVMEQVEKRETTCTTLEFLKKGAKMKERRFSHNTTQYSSYKWDHMTFCGFAILHKNNRPLHSTQNSTILLRKTFLAHLVTLEETLGLFGYGSTYCSPGPGSQDADVKPLIAPTKVTVHLPSNSLIETWQRCAPEC